MFVTAGQPHDLEDKMTLKKGDTVFLVHTDTKIHRGEDHTVRRVGRQWATLDNGIKIDKETLEFEDQNCRDEIYRTRIEWIEKNTKNALWGQLRDYVWEKYYDPSDIKLKNLIEACRALGVCDFKASDE